MYFSVIFSVLVFGVLSLLSFFIAKKSPEGEFRKWDFNSLPGVMTPNTLKSKEAWMKAHRATSSYFTLLAVYFSAAGALFIVLLAYDLSINYEQVFAVLLLFGILVFGILVVMGDRVAARHNKASQ
jgi:hypothetical protein